MKNSFKVAPDLLILRNSKSSFGGLFSSTSEKVVKIPHAMTPEDLQQLLDYFDLIAMNRFMKLFGQAEVQEVYSADELDQVFSSLAEYKVNEEIP
jgi:trans-2-enoyl-CoA reductase